MGNWTAVIEGTGIHDNNLAEDAEALIREFVEEKLVHHHNVARVTFTAGARKELLNSDDTSPLRAGETKYRPAHH